MSIGIREIDSCFVLIPMSVVSVPSDSACKWLQVKLDALLVGDSLPDYRRRNPEDLDENC